MLIFSKNWILRLENSCLSGRVSIMFLLMVCTIHDGEWKDLPLTIDQNLSYQSTQARQEQGTTQLTLGTISTSTRSTRTSTATTSSLHVTLPLSTRSTAQQAR